MFKIKKDLENTAKKRELERKLSIVEDDDLVHKG